MVKSSRLLQLCGVLIALGGLAGFWAARLGFFGHKTELSTVLHEGQRQLLGVGEEDFHVSFLLAGREIFYGAAHAEPVYDSSGRIVCWQSRGVRHVQGVNTDTVIYASLTNQNVTMVMLPRDLFIGSGTAKINGVYFRDGPDALRSAVSDILGVPVDYHAIINLEIFQNLVDAVGGVELDVPTRMYHHDCSAGLTIDLQPGLQHLDGVQASHFIRFRSSLRGDIDRVDNVKLLAYALLDRVQELNVGAVTRLPGILEAVFDEVETNVSLGFIVQELVPRMSGISINNAGTLPTREIMRDGVLGELIDEGEVENFLASTFGGEGRTFSQAPEARVTITNRSGVPGLEHWYVERLISYGAPPDLLSTRQDEPDSYPSRVVTTLAHLADADYYAGILAMGRQQIARFPAGNSDVDIEIVLGTESVLPPGFTAVQAAIPD